VYFSIYIEESTVKDISTLEGALNEIAGRGRKSIN